MKFLNHIRPRSKANKSPHDSSAPAGHHQYHHHTRTISHPYFDSPDTHFGPNPTARFSPALLEHVLAYVCPHARDDTFASCEESMLDDSGCMLCDMRDLAHCAAVNRQWYQAGQNVLYHNVRIDAVHYCDRELDLAQKRKSKAFNGSRSGDVREPAKERLILFSRTVRDNDVLASKVQYLKTPYMMREACMAELARSVSVLSSLRYIDLPDSFYTARAASNTLRSELQARCPDLRKMIYRSGSEDSFALLGPGGQWQNLEVLELDGLTVEPATLGYVLSSLSALEEVVLIDVGSFDNAAMGSLPPIPQVTLKDLPEVSIEGIANYFSHPGVDSTLASLTLANTAIAPSTLNQILASAPHLTFLSVSEAVSRPFPVTTPPPLVSKTLQTLHYEISTSESSPRGPPAPSESYYSYLASSIHAGGLPLLTQLYGLSTALPSLLLSPSYHSSHRATQSLSSNGGLDLPRSRMTSFSGTQQALQVFTKAISELEWNLTLITPPDRQHSKNGSATRTRPVSLYHPPELSPQWRATGRESVMVGNGFGGYLMVPGVEKEAGASASGVAGTGPPRSPRKKERDGWMG